MMGSINVDQVLANGMALAIILGAVGALAVRSIKNAINNETRAMIGEVMVTEITPKLNALTNTVNSHSIAIARLQGIEEGKQQKTAELRPKEIT